MNFRQQLGTIHGPTIKEQEAEVSRRFWELVKATKLKRWRKGDPIATTGCRLLVGLWTSGSPRDFEVAEKIAVKLDTDPSSLAIDVFDAMDPADMDDLQNYIPGIGKVFHTPIVGVWVDGRLMESADGFAGRQLIDKIIGSN